MSNISVLFPEGKEVADNISKRIVERFPITETAWMSLMNLDIDYPDALVKEKYASLSRKLGMETIARTNERHIFLQDEKDDAE